MDAEIIKTWVEIIQIILGTLALLIAGFWTFYIFVLGRGFTIHADITIKHTIASHQNSLKTLVLEIELKNSGRTAIKKMSGSMSLKPFDVPTIATNQASPLLKKIDPSVDDTLTSPKIRINLFKEQLYLEPGETTRESVSLIVDEQTEFIKITVHIKGRRAASIGGEQYWLSTEIINMR